MDLSSEISCAFTGSEFLQPAKIVVETRNTMKKTSFRLEGQNMDVFSRKQFVLISGLTLKKPGEFR